MMRHISRSVGEGISYALERLAGCTALRSRGESEGVAKVVPSLSPLWLELSGHSLGHPKQHHQGQQEPTERKEDRRAELVREHTDQND